MEEEDEAIKIKGALKLFKNTYPTMELVRKFKERSGVLGHSSLIKEATKFSRDLGSELSLTYPTPMCCTGEGEVAKDSKIMQKVRSAQQGKLIASRWEEEQEGSGGRDVRQSHNFSWLWQWRTCPTYVIAGVFELYEQLLRTRVYQSKKTRTGSDQIMCRLCGKAAETVAHVLAGCSALVQSKYLQRHNAVLKVIFFRCCTA